MKRLKDQYKGQVLYAALWMMGILSLIIASGAPNRLD